MGAKDSKPSFISYEDAERRVSDSEVRRIREAFKRCAGPNGTALSLESFVHEVLCDGVPYDVAEWLYQACGGTKRGIGFKDLLRGIVVITKGNLEEKIKFLWTLYVNNQSDNGTYIYKRDFAKALHLENTSLPVTEAQHSAEILLSLFGPGEKVTFEQFRSWLLIHKDATVLSKWLLSDRGNAAQELETPTFYQSLAGVTHLEERHASVGELLNCSAGSDDVFDAPEPPLSDGSIVGVDVASSAVCVWVRAVERPQWGALCPACMLPLGPPPAAPAPAPAPVPAPGHVAVALTGCQHMLHLHCLNEQLERLRANGEQLYITCLVCGSVYGREQCVGASVGAGGGAGGGAQPPGSMSWSLQPASIPVYPHAASILVTYNFQSGRQSAGQPCPGAAYYAVGFPRHSLLPDTALGRQVLSALRAAWEAGRLFAVRASRTTGREYVVAWRAEPPPAARRHYAQYAARAAADRALRDALAALHRLARP